MNSFALARAQVFCAVFCMAFLFSAVVPALAEPPAGSRELRSDGDRNAQRRRRRPRRARAAPPEEAAAPVEAPPAEQAPLEAAPAPSRGAVQEVSEVQRAVAGDAARREDESQGAGGTTLRRSSHMEFDARLIRGESAGTGAVILFDRAQRDLPPLTRQRTRFLDASIEPVLGADWESRTRAAKRTERSSE